MQHNHKRFEQLADENLLDFVAAGDEQAFAALLSRHHMRFYHMVYRWVMQAQDAEDIVQQAFLKLWSGKARFKKNKGARFTTWFYRILYNQSMDHLRTRKQQFVELNEQITASGENQEQDLALQQDQKQLHAALENLPENQRIAVQLFYFEELKQKDIAQIMGLSVKALESQLSRAKQNLRERLQVLSANDETGEMHHVSAR